MRRHSYEAAPEYDADAYKVDGFDGIAWYVLGWETEPDEDTEWTGVENRTGWLVATMVVDFYTHRIDPEDVSPLTRGQYCASCGQVGCAHSLVDVED